MRSFPQLNEFHDRLDEKLLVMAMPKIHLDSIIQINNSISTAKFRNYLFARLFCFYNDDSLFSLFVHCDGSFSYSRHGICVSFLCSSLAFFAQKRLPAQRADEEDAKDH